jgi:predicted dienelactone hydrolase
VKKLFRIAPLFRKNLNVWCFQKTHSLRGCNLKIKTIAFLTFLILSDNVMSQTFNIGHTMLSMTDSERGNRKVPVEVYYPADSFGDNVPVCTAGSMKFPVLCFAHGYLMSWGSYTYISDLLVPEGYIIAFPKTEGELFPSHMDMAMDISFILRKISEYGSDKSSIFFNSVQRMNCAMGHSMGGGSAVLAAGSDTSIAALAVLAPADTRPSAIKSAPSVKIPALIISGENDCITRPEAHQVPIFNGLSSISKLMIMIKGGSHCQMADKSFPCNLAELTCGPAPSVTREDQQKIIIRYLVPWLNYHLKGDSSSADKLASLIASDTCVVADERDRTIF